MSKTMTRLYDDYADATAAVRDLEALGIPHSDISIVANNAHGQHDTGGVNDEGDVSRGTSTGALLGGAGGPARRARPARYPGLGADSGRRLAGGNRSRCGHRRRGWRCYRHDRPAHSRTPAIPTREANFYSEGVRRGGTLVSAKVADADENPSPGGPRPQSAGRHGDAQHGLPDGRLECVRSGRACLHERRG